MPADAARRTDLYPPIEPYASGMLQLDGRHQMYWEESGDPRGVPVLFLHGGPGAGATPAHRRFFDPTYYRIVIFDQRGAGRSLPHGDLVDNTTPHLIEDIETLRRHRGIDSWHVFGGSWGSTLAIAYAEAHPEFIRLVNNENLYGARHLRGSNRVRALHSPLLEMIADILRRGAEQGVFRRDVDPVQLYISIAGLGYFYLSNNATLSAVFGRDLSTPMEKSKRRQHMVDVILGYLRP